MAEYLSWDCASASRLADIARSPRHAKYRIEHPSEPTEAMELGTAIHAAVLEPELFERTYRMRPPGDGRTKAVKEARELIEAQGFIALKEEAWDACQGVKLTVREHPIASKLIAKADGFEVCAVAEIDGVLVKVRADALLERAGMIVDLKSTLDASPEAFGRSIAAFKYHWSAALYLDVFAALGVSIDTYAFLALEKEPPYECAVYTLADTALELGRAKYKAALATYGECLLTGQWPGYLKTAQTIDIPAFEYKRAAEADDEGPLTLTVGGVRLEV
jgi:exodeoxyribonuclease VIII